MSEVPDFEASVLASGRLRVEPVSAWGAFSALRDSWRALEARDPEGTVFLSWDWLAQAFAVNPGRWRVMVVYHGPRLVGVLPLKHSANWSRNRKEFQTEIEAGGRLLGSEYTGFLCEPRYEELVIAALAETLKQIPWVRLSLQSESSRYRATKFLAAFPEATYSVRSDERGANKGEADKLICPRIDLPDEYEAWLSTGPSTDTRQRIRRVTRSYLNNGLYRLSHTAGASLKSDMGVLLRLWMREHASTMGAATARQLAMNTLRLLTAASRLGLLYLPVVRRDGQVIGALGHILDPRMKRVHLIVAGRGKVVTSDDVGLLLTSQAIGWAIDQGYETYDFCHARQLGDFDIGAELKKVASFSIRRRAFPGPLGVLDPICRPEVLERLLTFVETGETEAAIAACHQLLRMEQAG